MHLHAPKANLTCKCRPYVYVNNQPPGFQSAIVVSSARSLYYVALPLMVSARLPPFLNQIAPFEFQRIAVFFLGGLAFQSPRSFLRSTAALLHIFCCTIHGYYTGLLHSYFNYSTLGVRCRSTRTDIRTCK